ncbi:MAG TPA: metalloregulator ArsR/SmtB family transcription factor [Fimbriimonas sp.]
MTTSVDAAVERARMFKSLGDPTRVRIFDFLRSRCCAVAVGEEGDVHPIQGPTFGEVCCHVTGQEKITSTISFHLNELRDAGLISVEKRGRFMVCDVNREAVARLASYLDDAGRPREGCSSECQP